MIRERLRRLNARYAVSAAARVGPWCAGLQTVPPYVGVERDAQGRSFTIAAHVGVIDLRPRPPADFTDEFWGLAEERGTARPGGPS